MTNFDTITKTQAQTHPIDFVNLCFKFEQRDVTFLEIMTPEQLTVQMHQADMLIKVQINGKEVLVHFEFQTTHSSEPEMPLRMAGYIIRAIETYRLPMYSSVIYLRPDAGRRDPGHYVQAIAGHQILIEYQVLRLIEMDGAPILDARLAGLIPFTPLMKRPAAVSAEDWLRRCIQTADSVEVPDKAAYLGSLAILGDLVYDPEMILNTILEETMQLPTILEYFAKEAHQQGIQQGVQQGAREAVREDILEALALRLQPDTAETLKPTLDAIEDIQRLKELFRAAVLADTLEDFTQALTSNQN